MRNEDTYANDVKGYGTTYPCGWMGIKKPSGFPTKKKKGKVTIPLSKSTEQSILKQAGLK